MSSITVRQPQTPAEFSIYYDLRWRVLREPLGKERGTERDAIEDRSTHRAAFDGERIIGVGRVHLLSTEEAQVRYMAVDPAQQDRGIGSLVLSALEQEARAQGAQRMVLNARDTAVPFYLRHGYVQGESIKPADNPRPHFKMHKPL